jgi:hypothetical protein
MNELQGCTYRMTGIEKTMKIGHLPAYFVKGFGHPGVEFLPPFPTNPTAAPASANRKNERNVKFA